MDEGVGKDTSLIVTARARYICAGENSDSSNTRPEEVPELPSRLSERNRQVLPKVAYFQSSINRIIVIAKGLTKSAMIKDERINPIIKPGFMGSTAIGE